MKVGILTLPLNTNYGGLLQAYALQTVIERMGHDVKVIAYPLVEKPSFLRRCIDFVYRFLRRRILLDKRYRAAWIGGAYETYLIRQHTNRFIKQHIHGRYTYDLNQIRRGEFDAIVVGSDQVWRKSYSWWKRIEDQYLDFAKGWELKRISYAASFGKDDVNDYDEIEIRDIKVLLKSFDAVSVRESSGLCICKKIFGIEALLMLDPTLLLDVMDYNRLIASTKEVEFNGNCFKYVLDENDIINDAIKEIERINEWSTFKVNGCVNNKLVSIDERIQLPVEQWLQAFRDAEAVVTDSFHACVFSIIYNKPFLVFGNSKRGLSRFDTLLDIIGQRERLVNTKKECLLKIDLLKTAPNAMSRVEHKRQDAFVFLNHYVR